MRPHAPSCLKTPSAVKIPGAKRNRGTWETPFPRLHFRLVCLVYPRLPTATTGTHHRQLPNCPGLVLLANVRADIHRQTYVAMPGQFLGIARRLDADRGNDPFGNKVIAKPGQ